MSTKEQVLKVMKETAEAMRTGEIVQKSGLDKKEVEKAMKDLKTEELIFSPKRCFWQAK